MNGTGGTPATASKAPILIDGLNHSVVTLLVVFVAYVVLLATSGRIVRATLRYAKIDPTGGDDDEPTVDTGRAIGKVENVLVLTLMIMQAYTALGVIFAAKSLVRKDDMSGGDTSYYLTGTLANFTFSIAIGVGLHVLLWLIVSAGLF